MGAYSSWPLFPAEAVDVDDANASLVRLVRDTAGALFNVDPTLIGVDAFPAAVRASIGLDEPITCG